jgi:hypothetical protein
MTDMPTPDPTQREILDMADTWARGSVLPHQDRLIRDLAQLEPELQPIVADHVAYFQEMLPTLVMGDIARWAETVAANSDDPAERLKPVMDKLDQAWGDGNGPVAELIAVGFVENTFDNPTLVQLMGPNLSRYQRLYTGHEKEAESATKSQQTPEIMKQIRRKLGLP